MILKKVRPIIPSKRSTEIVNFIFPRNYKKKYLYFYTKGHKRSRTSTHGKYYSHLRTIIKKPTLIFNHWKYIDQFVVNESVFYTTTYKLFISFRNMFGFESFSRYLTTSVVGNIYVLLPLLNIHDVSILNTLQPLWNIPIYLNICYIQNTVQSKFTYCLSAGSVARKLQAKKPAKLVLVELPSGKHLHLNKFARCFVGSMLDHFKNKIILGKYGSLYKTKLYTYVRGVAKNPVDHPNGGRTKAKQPEKSPWGWIAKHNK